MKTSGSTSIAASTPSASSARRLRTSAQGRRAQGASTLTQQLARQSFLTLDKTYRRKFQEVIVAAELESEYSKDEILELYLNKVYFGDGLHGIEAAALGYFGKHAGDVTLAEAALLAGLVKSPSSYAPTVEPRTSHRAPCRGPSVDGRCRRRDGRPGCRGKERSGRPERRAAA